MIIICKTPKKKFQVRVTACNGKILLNSRPYATKRAAINCIKAVGAMDNFASPDDGFSASPDLEVEDRTGNKPVSIYLRNF
jgi:uncharacterized protein YegP (UPF0339 family)